MGFITENPGVLTTIQDEGRYGYEQFGMSPAGPMDLRAFRTANLLVDNDPGESALEATALGPALRFDQDNVAAVTGADMAPTLNGRPCPMYQAVAVKAGDVLRLGAAKSGLRSYIAFAGGLDVPQVMGSRATALQNQVGGYQGRRLAKGDAVGFRAPNPGLALPRVAPVPPPEGKEAVIRVILGPQDDMFTQEGLNTFLSQPYTVSKDFDRMGCRLEGAVIAHSGDGNIISDGMVTGAIQVPTSGQPIIMLAERQTVGGYTKIATVISADLPRVGQRKTGDVIRFQAVTVEEAHQLWRAFHQELEELKAQLDRPQPSQPVQPAITYRVTVNGRSYQVQVVRHT
ncbi:biotin-dependent carboxyltransferase [Pseudoflavonifractor sp. 60]|mgnify:CR=1 FL=1|uniref:5-oxoprolinase subunit C family protein n=1 Tax=Pseudoflavonifractor sp. 60 TaxID=2304576 RepID=UPI0013688E87|nr:biotin-dependent carboxyltransferase family protein [Pseudoflavonifractor sp. 60]NBI68167.1 biotin-dependent carboxyltransferase [Pseudoflavonifractor sp. 60]